VALRKDLGKYQKYIEGLKLIDYRVRILNGGTEAITRVLIESEDEKGERWTTIGVSPNIIDASFQALMDSVIYKLVKSGAPGVTAIAVIAPDDRLREAIHPNRETVWIASSQGLLAMTVIVRSAFHDRSRLRRCQRPRTIGAVL